MRVEEYLGEAAFRELEAPWSELHREAAASPFLSHEWMSGWHRALGGGKRPRILTAWKDKRLVGLLPLSTERLHPGGLPLAVERLAFLGEKVGGADYLDVLAAPGLEARATEALLAHLASDRSQAILDLYEVAADSHLLPSSHRHLALGRGMRQQIVPRYLCPQVDLEGGWQAVLARSGRASNLRRRRRQVEALGGEFREVRGEEEASAAFDRFLHLHELRWAQEGGSDGLGTPALLRFHREVVPALARAGWLRFEELWVEGACRASIYGLDAGEAYYFYQSGFDPAWSRKSVGLVLLGHSMEQAASRGVRVYDFLHGAEAYKLEWATRSRQTVAIRCLDVGWGSAALLVGEELVEAARAWAHALLPQGAVETLRKLRKERERRLGEEGERWRRGIWPSGA